MRRAERAWPDLKLGLSARISWDSSGSLDEALEELTRAQTALPADPIVARYRAEVLALLDRPDESLVALDRVE